MERYAVYFTPPEDHPLTRAASQWLGRDPFRDATITIGHDFAVDVATPARYGFHGTLKAPFRLADGVDARMVETAQRGFCNRQKPFSIPKITITIGRIGPFFALVPVRPSAALNAFASAAVRDFEPLRAKLTEAEYAKRKPESLSPRQRELLDKWGYPYVLDEFRFHMTLTGPVPERRRDAVESALRGHFAEFIDRPLSIDGCALFGEPSPGAPFIVTSYMRLAS